jgi:hypothetical protein
VAAALFAAVSGATKLQRVALRGDWTCSQTVLLNFVEHHASTLRIFMLTDFMLDGRWLEILHRLADLTRGKLQYLSIKRPIVIQKWNNDVSFKDAKFTKYRHNWWPQFSCTTNFMPSLNLLLSLSDEGSDVKHGVSKNGKSTSTEHDNIQN